MKRRVVAMFGGGLASLVLAACGGVSPPGSGSAGAEDFPSGPITVVVKSSAGSGTDLMARQAAKFLEEELDQPVAVENLTAGDGVAAVQRVLSSPPNGTVVGADTYSLVVKLAGDLSSRYSPSDFDFLAQVQSGPYMLVVPSNSEIKTLDDFTAAVKKDSKFSVGGYGAKSGDQLFKEALDSELGVNPQYVPFEGGSEVITAALGNNVDAAVTTVNNAVTYIQSGELRGLGIAAEKPVPQISNVKTFSDQGLGLSMDNYRYFYTAKDTPDAIVKKWDEALKALSKDPAWQKYLEHDGLVNTFIPSDELTKKIDRDVEAAKSKL